MAERQANDAVELCNSCEGGREGMEVTIVAISGSVHVSTGAAVTEVRVGESGETSSERRSRTLLSREGDREGMEVKIVAISGSVHVSTGAAVAEVRVGKSGETSSERRSRTLQSREGGREGMEVVAILGSAQVQWWR